jgi:hypothetical protein
MPSASSISTRADARPEARDKQRAAGDKRHQQIRVAITVVFLVMAGLAQFRVVSVEQHTIILLVLAALPWLTFLVKSVELPGGVKVELQQLRDSAMEARSAAASAEVRAEVAIATARQVAEPRPDSSHSLEEMRRLAQEYNDLVRTQPERTGATGATAIVARMIAVASGVGDFDVSSALQSRDPGERLGGYAFINAKPASDQLKALLAALEREPKSFCQYWAIRAIGAVASQAPSDFPRWACRRLMRLEYPAASDRFFEVRRIIGSFCQVTQPMEEARSSESSSKGG